MCGQPETLIAGTGRILGGQNAKLGEIPWQLFIKEPSRGGASLINDQWAVTAAHVVDGNENSPLSVFGGLTNRRTTNAPSTPSLITNRIIIHPGYSKGITGSARTDYNNDIALIRFTSRVKLGPNLLPICLPEENSGVIENEQGTVSGWGKTERNAAAVLLKYAHVTAYSRRECENTPRLNGNRMIFSNNMFCAGDSGKDSCEGDSGGPFVLPMLSSSRGPYYLTGIVSWGDECKLPTAGSTRIVNKGYYTKVGNYVKWIKQTIERVEAEESERK